MLYIEQKLSIQQFKKLRKRVGGERHRKREREREREGEEVGGTGLIATYSYSYAGVIT